MIKLILCAGIAAYTAAMHVEFRWERDLRRDWHAYAQAVHEERGDLPLEVVNAKPAPEAAITRIQRHLGLATAFVRHAGQTVAMLLPRDQSPSDVTN